jgi:hypothetical protein
LKQKIAILFLFILFFISSISGLIFEIEKVITHFEVKNYLLKNKDKVSLILFKVSINYDEDEFEYNHTMYDVVFTKTQNNTKILFCFNDKNETNVLRTILGLENYSKQKSKKESTFYSLIYFMSGGILYDNNIDIKAPCQISIAQYSYYGSAKKLISLNVEIPPPNIFI